MSDLQAKIAVGRAAILKKTDGHISGAIEILHGPGVNSEDRAGVLCELLFATSYPETFWPVFLHTWQCCDDTWQWSALILAMLRDNSRTELGPTYGARSYMSTAQATAFDELSDPLKIYRGCHRSRVRGLSWTLDMPHLQDLVDVSAQGNQILDRHGRKVFLVQVLALRFEWSDFIPAFFGMQPPIKLEKQFIVHTDVAADSRKKSDVSDA